MTVHQEENRFSGAAPVIPRGVAFFRLSGPVKTREFAFLALPRFTLLAFSSAIEFCSMSRFSLGRYMLPYARRVVGLLDAAATALRVMPLSDPVRIGSPQEYCETILPRILASFAERQPEVEVSVRCDYCCRRLRRRRRANWTSRWYSPRRRSPPARFWGSSRPSG